MQSGTRPFFPDIQTPALHKHPSHTHTHTHAHTPTRTHTLEQKHSLILENKCPVQGEGRNQDETQSIKSPQFLPHVTLFEKKGGQGGEVD